MQTTTVFNVPAILIAVMEKPVIQQLEYVFNQQEENSTAKNYWMNVKVGAKEIIKEIRWKQEKKLVAFLAICHLITVHIKRKLGNVKAVSSINVGLNTIKLTEIMAITTWLTQPHSFAIPKIKDFCYIYFSKNVADNKFYTIYFNKRNERRLLPPFSYKTLFFTLPFLRL